MRPVLVITVFALFLFASCHPKQLISDSSREGSLIFQSGFEPGSTVVPLRADADITGRDNAFASASDWINDLDNHPDIGNFNLQYQGGDSSMRFAKIVPEPGRPVNRVLHFWLDKPNVDGSKGRIQANLYGNKGMKSFYQSVRMFLPDDFKSVRSFPKEIHWLTIAEFWNNVTWSQTVPYGFRITLGIGKDVTGESDLHFIIDAQDCELFADGRQKYTTIWSEINKDISVPIGQWFTMEYHYKEGDNETGRFYLSVTPERGKKQTVFDIRKVTHNSMDPNPDGVTDFNPMKLYTSKELIQYMNNQGKTLQIYWDDFKLWKDKTPG